MTIHKYSQRCFLPLPVSFSEGCWLLQVSVDSGNLAISLSRNLSAKSVPVKEMSQIMRKLVFCLYENKDADQRLCFRYWDSAIPFSACINKNSAAVDIAPASGKVNRP